MQAQLTCDDNVAAKDQETSSAVPSAKEKLRAYLNHRMRISCDDSRQFTGIFKCVDNSKNIILSDTTETRQDSQRYVGMIMVPGDHIRQILVENLEYV
ncbi:hypothetical protein GGI15_003830 [Coemansia interrupta]|uniref:Sm domain-containing protein n=1 Tax=Coemansia interrupta TaxID=1126814 RepID=A0A9W8HDT1_9FUNG|nr:hypothetical protein GGI15_003830 [Coemansia interrupta]